MVGQVVPELSPARLPLLLPVRPLRRLIAPRGLALRRRRRLGGLVPARRLVPLGRRGGLQDLAAEELVRVVRLAPDQLVHGGGEQLLQTVVRYVAPRTHQGLLPLLLLLGPALPRLLGPHRRDRDAQRQPRELRVPAVDHEVVRAALEGVEVDLDGTDALEDLQVAVPALGLGGAAVLGRREVVGPGGVQARKPLGLPHPQGYKGIRGQGLPAVSFHEHVHRAGPPVLPDVLVRSTTA
mmetsp:Transcript_28393/g.80218  ORF Transcript_28393/g.80218 Transcript_28393/m.80218 type:complete len:238 (-) Transcript_28393:13-726(-)|eukprot:CAMPEP_0179263816 /NCGR_PEP_ID=MMETSP0797-20121207/28072_1 /TAXON_ID=47934 /ORGANISM="Dinophysis acuminata, Strain DAEP01" /LENGTH=237 /DNA_ID=CAMNT_0020971983 /DNA_START=66 /DNA_END=779 /DNA_ORIENTATION=+